MQPTPQNKISVDRKFNYDVQRAICTTFKPSDDYYSGYKYSQNHDIFNKKNTDKTGKKYPFTSFILKHQKQPFSEQIFGFQDYQLHYDLQRELLLKLPANVINKKSIILDNAKLYMIHHLFNNTEFTKQDFLLDIQNEDFANISNTYGNVVFVYRIELKVSEETLNTFQIIQDFISDLVYKSRSKQEVATITSNVNAVLKTITVYCTLETVKSLMSQMPLKQQSSLQTTLQIVQFLQYTIGNIKTLKMNINPEYIGVRQKTNDSFVKPYFWVESFTL